MLQTNEHNKWRDYFHDFNRRYRWRPTSLLLIDETTVQRRECGLPLLGISLDKDRDGSTRMHIMVGAHDLADHRHHTFTITSVHRLAPNLGTDGKVESLEIEDEQGTINLLRFGPSDMSCATC